jgi:hypothetical protein
MELFLEFFFEPCVLPRVAEIRSIEHPKPQIEYIRLTMDSQLIKDCQLTSHKAAKALVYVFNGNGNLVCAVYAETTLRCTASSVRVLGCSSTLECSDELNDAHSQYFYSAAKGWAVCALC